MNRFLWSMVAALLLIFPVLCCGAIDTGSSSVQAAAPRQADTVTPTSFGSNSLLLSTVHLHVMTPPKEPGGEPVQGSGTGFAVEILNDGSTLMVTAGHVCAQDLRVPNSPAHEQIHVHTAFGSAVDGEIIWFSMNPDLCTFKIKSTLPPYPVSTSYSPSFDDEAMSIQAPFGFFPTKKKGSFSYVTQDTGDYVFSMPAAKGSSGSPIARDGEIIGMVFAVIGVQPSDWSEIVVAEPAHRIRRFIAQTKQMLELTKIIEEGKPDESALPAE